MLIATPRLASRSAQGRGERGQDFFCDFQLHRQASDHPLGLGDAVLVAALLIVAFEEALQAFKSDVLPAGDEFGFQLVLPGGCGRAPLAREAFEDDLGLELGGERPATALWHGSALPGGQS
jgi:hypothetical protein